jgi:hypothetical protein
LLLAGFLAMALYPVAYAQAGASNAPFRAAAPRVEIAAGWSSWNPSGALSGISFGKIGVGSMYSGSYFFSRYWGAKFEADLYPESVNDGDQRYSAGPVFRFPGPRTTPFVHALFGGTRLTGPNAPTLEGTGYFYNGCRWGAAMTLGGGVDYVIPQLHGRFALRILQADYERLRVYFGPLYPTSGGTASMNAISVSSGLVLRLGKR